MPDQKPRKCARCGVRDTFNAGRVCTGCLGGFIGSPIARLPWRQANELVDGVETGPRVVRVTGHGVQRCGGGIRRLVDWTDY